MDIVIKLPKQVKDRCKELGITELSIWTLKTETEPDKLFQIITEKDLGPIDPGRILAVVRSRKK